MHNNTNSNFSSFWCFNLFQEIQIVSGNNGNGNTKVGDNIHITTSITETNQQVIKLLVLEIYSFSKYVFGYYFYDKFYYLYFII